MRLDYAGLVQMRARRRRRLQSAGVCGKGSSNVIHASVQSYLGELLLHRPQALLRPSSYSCIRRTASVLGNDLCTLYSISLILSSSPYAMFRSSISRAARSSLPALSRQQRSFAVSTIRKPLALTQKYAHRRNYAIAAEDSNKGVVSSMMNLARGSSYQY